MSRQRNFLGPYRLVRMIRAGTTTQVWEALKEGEADRVALKVLLQSQAKNRQEIDYLKHETMVGQQLDHPNVIRIFEYAVYGGLPLIVMQLFNARNLKIELREKPEFIGINVKPIIRKAAEGLQHLHEAGWVHCDVKPDNFLADEQANVKLIDFSIAEKMGSGGGVFRRFRSIRGTRSYIAPEQIRKKKLDARSDIYGFGCVLFELMAGRPPFTAPTPDELLRKHLRTTAPSLEALSGATRELAILVTRMLAKDPGKRPQSMLDFLGEFNRIGVYRAGHRPKGLQK